MRMRATALGNEAPEQPQTTSKKRSSRLDNAALQASRTALAAWTTSYIKRLDQLKKLLNAAFDTELAAVLPVQMRCVVHNGRACNTCNSGESIVGRRLWCQTCDLNFCDQCASKHEPLDHILQLHRVPVPGARVRDLSLHLPHGFADDSTVHTCRTTSCCNVHRRR